MFYISNLQINSKLALAPMAGVTDYAFRTICRELGAGLTFTEMISSKALVYQDSKTLELLKIGENEHPVGVQIFGSEPNCMAQAAVKALEVSGADFIDINMGCPVNKIVKSGDGSALMRNPEKAAEIIKAVKSAIDKPVTVKFRKGWDKGSINAVEFAIMAEDSGVSAITIHGRTRTQMYSGKADWSIIRDVKAAVKVPVIANGDVYTAQDAVKILDYTGADVAMIGRGAMGDPWIFAEAKALLNGEEIPQKPPIGERAETALRQFEMAAKHKGEKIACLEARKHYSWYLRGVPYSGYFKSQIAKAETLDDLRKITEGIKREL
ncbi:MAG: tRNA dihydrouridine synthase DusB [Oscillospiraceae bacterium]|jgi:tRNA-dihydrouridine synthase B|nr:tRNA dihydrouridine synthase DusB [Oscillospiraceae bacterium]